MPCGRGYCNSALSNGRGESPQCYISSPPPSPRARSTRPPRRLSRPDSTTASATSSSVSPRRCASAPPSAARRRSGAVSEEEMQFVWTVATALRFRILARLVPERERQPEQLRVGGRRCRLRHRSGHAFRAAACLILVRINIVLTQCQQQPVGIPKHAVACHPCPPAYVARRTTCPPRLGRTPHGWRSRRRRRSRHPASVRHAAGVAFAAAAGISLLPAIILLLRHLALRCWRPKSKAQPVASIRRDSSESQPLSSQGETRHKLAAARRALANTRLRVSGGLLQLGWAVCVFGATPNFTILTVGIQLDWVIGPFALWNAVAAAPGLVILALAILPVDTRAVRSTCWMTFTICTLFGFLFVNLSLLEPRPMFVLLAVAFLGTALLLSPTLCCSFCCPKRAMHPRAALRRLWRVFRLGLVAIGAISLVELPFGLEIYPWTWWAHPYWAMSITASWWLLVAATTPRNRGRFHRFINSLGSKNTKEAEAATIAALVGGGSASDALAEGAARFRALRLTELQESDLINSADSGLYEKTAPAKLGHVEDSSATAGRIRVPRSSSSSSRGATRRGAAASPSARVAGQSVHQAGPDRRGEAGRHRIAARLPLGLPLARRARRADVREPAVVRRRCPAPRSRRV